MHGVEKKEEAMIVSRRRTAPLTNEIASVSRPSLTADFCYLRATPTIIERAHSAADAIIERGNATTAALASQNERLGAAHSRFSSTNTRLDDTYVLAERAKLVMRRRHLRVVAATICTILFLYVIWGGWGFAPTSSE